MANEIAEQLISAGKAREHYTGPMISLALNVFTPV